MALRLAKTALCLVLAICLHSCQGAEAREPYTYRNNWSIERTGSRLLNGDTPWREDGLKQEFDAVARRIEKAMRLPAYFVEIDVMNCSTRKATAFSGGWIRICLPFAIDLESEDEIAFVLAHEISHVAYDHTNGYGKHPADDFAYNPALEFIADASALEVMVAMGYSPEGANLFFEKFTWVVEESKSDPFMVKRANQLQQAIEHRYQEASESRQLTPLSPRYQQATDFAVTYMTEIDNLYRLYVAAHMEGAKAPTVREGDTIRARACVNYYDRLSGLADRLGYTDVIGAAAVSAYVTCGFYTGVIDRLDRFIAKHVRLRNASGSLLDALMMSAIFLKTDLDVEVAKELHRRIFEEPPHIPEISADLRQRFVAGHTLDTFLDGCLVLGYYNSNRADRAYFDMSPAESRWLRTRAVSKAAFDVWMSSCSELRAFGQSQQKNRKEHIYRSRLRIGDNPENSKNVSDVFSRIEAIPTFMSDAMALGLILTPSTNEVIRRSRDTK